MLAANRSDRWCVPDDLIQCRDRLERLVEIRPQYPWYRISSATMDVVVEHGMTRVSRQAHLGHVRLDQCIVRGPSVGQLPRKPGMTYEPSSNLSGETERIPGHGRKFLRNHSLLGWSPPRALALRMPGKQIRHIMVTEQVDSIRLLDRLGQPPRGSTAIVSAIAVRVEIVPRKHDRPITSPELLQNRVHLFDAIMNVPDDQRRLRNCDVIWHDPR